jgi:hypothetical protein
MSSNHFKGKSVPEHLKEARKKGALASAEVHGTEMAGHIGAFADSIKETSVYLVILWVIFHQLQFTVSQTLSILALFSCGIIVWKGGRSALLGWARLERLHRVTEEERWEIEHHRAQEKEELRELYLARGFTGKLLDEAVEVLMADDNRLLNVMLEEELGLTLEVFEHPLKQALFASLGALLAAALLLLSFYISPVYGVPGAATATILLSSIIAAKKQKNEISVAIIWNLATAALVGGLIFFIAKWYKAY